MSAFVCIDVVAAQVELLQHAVRVQGRRERPRAISADVVVGEVQARERRVVVEDRRERPRALSADVVHRRGGGTVPTRRFERER
jgi:hypothetical protein